jgi:acyl-CoA synthetase (AMP-forming)/AMP-acid ligase II
MLIRDYLAGNAMAWPERLGYVAGTTRLSWGAVADRSWRLAAALQALDIGKGDVVGIIGPDTHHMVESWFAANTIGAVRTGINFRYAAREMAHIIQDAEVKVLLIHGGSEATYRAIDEEMPSVRAVIGFGKHSFDLDYEAVLAAHPPEPTWPGLDRDERVAISYTTGSTGKPKGALWRHGAVVDALLNTVLQADVRHDDVYLHSLPAAGVPILLATWNVCNGSAIVLQERFSARGAIELIQQERVTCLLWVPTMIVDVLNDPEISAFDLSSLRLVIYGSAPASPALVRRAMGTLGCELQQWYGSTEGCGGWYTMLHHEDHLRGVEENPALLSSCGRPTVHCRIAVKDEAGRDLPAGEVGEICVRSETLMDGYLHLEAETSEALRDGWLYTGDLGRQDEHGYVYLVDRKKFMIISGGYNIYPVVVENVLAEHPRVREVCVVGIPEDRWGETVCAWVVPDGDLTTAELVEFCAGRMAAFEVPKRIDFVESLPRGVTGKVLKTEVRRLAATTTSS